MIETAGTIITFSMSLFLLMGVPKFLQVNFESLPYPAGWHPQIWSTVEAFVHTVILMDYHQESRGERGEDWCKERECKELSLCDESHCCSTWEVTASALLRKDGILWKMCVGSDQSGLKSCGGRLVRTDHLPYCRLKRDFQRF